jgi:hypothetical protein
MPRKLPFPRHVATFWSKFWKILKNFLLKFLSKRDHVAGEGELTWLATWPLFDQNFGKPFLKFHKIFDKNLPRGRPRKFPFPRHVGCHVATFDQNFVKKFFKNFQNFGQKPATWPATSAPLPPITWPLF